jgi:phosphonate transport system permease protein
VAARFWWRGRAPWVAVRALLAIPRGMHEVVWGLLLLAVVGLDPVVAVLAIGLPYGAVTAKVVSEILDEADPRPWASLRAAGAGRLAATLYGRLPLARRDLISYAFYRLECAIRSAAILGIVGAGGSGSSSRSASRGCATRRSGPSCTRSSPSAARRTSGARRCAAGAACARPCSPGRR